MNKQALTLQKRWKMFWLAEAAALLIYIVLCWLFRRSGYRAWVLVPAGILLVILSVLWIVYYYRLEYSVQDGMLVIDSGILFRKRRVLPPDNILWEMRLTSPLFHGAAMVVLHTSGGQVVIFGEYSTVS